MYIFECFSERRQTTYTPVIKDTDAFNLRIGSKVAHDASNEQAMIWHIGADQSPVEVLSRCWFQWIRKIQDIRQSMVAGLNVVGNIQQEHVVLFSSLYCSSDLSLLRQCV